MILFNVLRETDQLIEITQLSSKPDFIVNQIRAGNNTNDKEDGKGGHV